MAVSETFFLSFVQETLEKRLASYTASRNATHVQRFDKEKRMYSKVKSMGHPMHLMLVNFPLGLLVTAVIFDVVHWITGNGYWSELAFWMIAAGSIGGLVAAVVGTIDWTGIPEGTRARKVGIWHGIGNLVVLVLFAASWLLRLHAPGNPSISAYVLSLLGAALLGATGWLGGELTGRYGVGIDEGANLNAPGTLSELPAHHEITPASHSSSQQAGG